MLADKKRVDTFRKAIFETVAEGDIVVDIGTGTGILAFFALQAGARKVYALESGSVIEVARRTAEENGFENRIEFIQEHSMNAVLAERADLIVTETIGCFAFDENITAVADDARRRFLKKGGRILPRRLKLWAVAVQFVDRHPWGSIGSEFYGLAHQHLQDLAANSVFSLKWSELGEVRQLSRPAPLMTIDLYECTPLTYPVRIFADCNLIAEGRFHGLLVYPEIILTNDRRISLLESNAVVSSHWDMTFFPIRIPVAVCAGETLGGEIAVTAEGGFTWRFSHHSAGKTRTFSHLSLFGHPSLSHLIPR